MNTLIDILDYIIILDFIMNGVHLGCASSPGVRSAISRGDGGI